MSEITICDMCGRKTPEDTDWEYAFRKDICPICRKLIIKFIEEYKK